MNLKEKYDRSTKWPDKARVIEIYHLLQKNINPKWTQIATGKYFGLEETTVSEYLTLAKAMHKDEKLEHKFETKEKALRSLGSARYMQKRYKHLDDEE